MARHTDGMAGSSTAAGSLLAPVPLSKAAVAVVRRSGLTRGAGRVVAHSCQVTRAIAEFSLQNRASWRPTRTGLVGSGDDETQNRVVYIVTGIM